MKSGGKKTRIVLYSASIILVLFYIIVMWWGITPKVGIEYKMYYITHELSDWPGYGRLSYKLGTKEICTSYKDRNGSPYTWDVCVRKGQGWKREQYDGSVSNASESYIYYLPEKNADNVTYTIEVKNVTGAVKVYADDKQIGEFEKDGTYSFKAGNAVSDKLFTIKFETERGSSFTLWSTCLE